MQTLRRALLASLSLVLVAPAAGEVEISVKASKRTTKTAESGSGSQRTTSYIDRVTLEVTLTGHVQGDVSCYFIARDTRTHANKYHGVTTQAVRVAGRQSLSVESEPAAYSQSKRRSETAADRRGELPFGWVVIVAENGRQVAVKASSPQALHWVQEHPPPTRKQASP